ncbi:MAG: diguanylate cyclase, partial [Erysipelotrichaceae bacterium]|nr:diguanylate cyclase [Erysipelotrichaceae bacterium]
YQTLDNPGFQSVTVSNLGALYLEMHELGKAEDFTNRALIMAREEKNRMIESACLQYLGVIAKEKGHFEEALHYYNESLDVYRETRELIHEAEVLLEFHKLYFEQGDTALSLEYLNEAMLIAEEVSSNTLISDICSELTKVHEFLGNNCEALKFAKKRFEAIETVEQQERDQRLRGIGIQLEADLSFQEKESYRILSQKLESKAQQLEERSEELAETYHTLKAISNIGKTITATLSLEEIFDLVYHYVTDLMEMDVFGIGLYQPEMDAIEYRFLVEDSLRLYDTRIPLSSTSSWAVWCFKHQKEVMVNSVEEENSGALSHISSSAGALMAAVMFNPLKVEDKIIGVITVQSKMPNVYNNQTQEILGTLSAYLSIAIQNAQKSEKLQEEIRQREHAQQELSELNMELAELSELDGLTGIANRRRFDEFYLQEWNRAIRAQQNVALLMVDIDFFKQYNDHYGHLSGDEIIIRIAHLIKECVKRSSDLVARFGGDEFIVLLSDTDTEGAKIVAKNIQDALLVCGIKHDYSEICPYITLSIGIAVVTPTQDLQPSLLIQKGDLALYQAKQSGRNQVRVFGA